MRCPTCGKDMTCKKVDHKYLESGLDNVILVGVDLCQCICGEKIYSVPAVNELHGLLAFSLLKKRSLLNGKEIRFLRKNAGLTALRLGEIMGVHNSTISRWENGKQPIEEARDRLLRLIFMNIKGISPEQIRSLIEEDFDKISPEIGFTPPYMIPLDKWSKRSFCLSE